MKPIVCLCRPFLGSQNMYFVFIQLLSSGSAWFAIILMVVTCLFLDVMKKVFDRQLHPTSTEKAQVTTFYIQHLFNYELLMMNNYDCNLLTSESRKLPVPVSSILQYEHCQIWFLSCFIIFNFMTTDKLYFKITLLLIKL